MTVIGDQIQAEWGHTAQRWIGRRFEKHFHEKIMQPILTG